MRYPPRFLLLLGALSFVAADRPEPAAHPANRLAKESSPYLLMHAHNPVDWYPWGPEAFARAKAENKPIFLSVGYSSCYWCHVMERQCFENEAIARAMNEKFVCVKVDREERPDVDQIYMTALLAFGGGGGWPMSMFLTPDGKPFFGGTYFPPTDRDGMTGFPKILDGVANAWRDERREVLEAGDNLADAVRRSTTAAANRRRVPLSRAFATEGRTRLADEFDPVSGGFGFDPENPRKPKFPEPSNLLFLLDQNRRHFAGPLAPTLIGTGAKPLPMVVTTLDHLARGGIRDHLAGGYHRYSVDRSWTVPHFEKMLYDNALLAAVHLAAFESTGDPRWKQEAVDTFRFIEHSMTDPAGAFYSALDAETEGEEGAYYVWKPDDVKAILGDEDFDLFAAVYGFDRPSNFENERYVLHERRPRTEAADALGLTPETLEIRLVPLRAKLLAAREKRPSPLLDDKVLTSWNGLMIAAYADGYRTLKDDSYRLAAEKAADFLLKTHRDNEGKLLRTSRDGKAKLAAYLEDYAFLAHGLLRLHAATGDAKRLDQARELADRMLAEFEDKELGGFFFTAEGHETLLVRVKDPYDSALPSGNSVAVRVLLSLAETTGEARYRDAAGRALDAFSAVMSATPHGVPYMLIGLSTYLDRQPDIDANSAIAASAEAVPAVVSVAATLADVENIAPGSTVPVTLTLNIKPGWHLTANPAGSANLKPTVVTLKSDSAAIIDVSYPKGAKLSLPGGDEPILAYEGETTLTARVRLNADATTPPSSLTFQIRYQACNDRACLAPATLETTLSLDPSKR
jgi:uncharacterized protein YyaL (SSP411 family)